jgi:TRAP transporter TatT component family protein
MPPPRFAIDPDADPSHRLVTLITQKRAKLLLQRIDDLFLEPMTGSR